MSRVAVIESAKEGIAVNCIAPGMIAAGMFLATPEHHKTISIEQTTMERAGPPGKMLLIALRSLPRQQRAL
jgi:NAD(P)-dependent dehydrogenase (short-subunit alcohol dehydrogenase family)